MGTENIPGLVSRKFYIRGGWEYVCEEWDLTVPGCPMIAIDNSKWGTGESVRDLSVLGVTRTVKLRRVKTRLSLEKL